MSVHPHLRAWKARRQPLPHIRSGSAYGYRSAARSEFGRPLSTRSLRDRWGPSLHVGNVGCCFHTQAEHTPVLITGHRRLPSIVKEPALTSWWAARDSNPNAPVREKGFTARQRTIRTYRPTWRQRQDSLPRHATQWRRRVTVIARSGITHPDPRVLEARMLPLHHAASVSVTSVIVPEDRPSLRPDPTAPRVQANNKKGLLGGSP